MRGAPTAVLVAACAVPVLVGQFAWLSAVPIALVVAGALVDVRLRAVRWPALVLLVAYAVPYVVWKTRPDPAPSLSRDIDPVLAVLIVIAALGVVVTFLASRRSARASKDRS